MAKDSFQFRQFTVSQQRCAMKVGTDGVLLGAWADAPSATSVLPRISEPSRSPGDRACRILDIGTGTGLIALMMAQRFPQAAVTAIDISSEAVLEARDNAAASPFTDRIRVLESDVNVFGISEPFDAIVCNPPYFIDSLASPDDQRTLARHTASLTYAQLIAAAWRLLSDHGRLSLTIPADSRSRLEAEARLRGFFLTRLCAVKTTPRKAPKRYLMEFQKHTAAEVDTTEAVLETSPGERSPWYRRLTDAFYIR